MPDIQTEPLSEVAFPKIRWGWVLAYGVLLILTGVVALIDPLATGVVTGIFIGFTIAFYGVIAIAAGISFLSGGIRWIELILGVMALVVGGWLIMMPLVGSVTLVWMLGAWLTVAGIAEIVSAFQTRADRGWRIFLGIVHIALGMLILFMDLTENLVLLAVLISISFLSRGIFLIFLAVAGRRTARMLS